jgi:very-short-patch-repair endonuclease
MTITTDALISGLAARQHGVVSRQQLLTLGVTPRMVELRLANGSLVSLHRGVYRVGPLESPHTRDMAAVLACGGEAVVSHRSAALLWGLIPRSRRPRAVDVSVVEGAGGRRRRGIRVYRIRRLPEADRTALHALPITTPVRTLLDLARISAERVPGRRGDRLGWVSPREVEQAVAQAEREGLIALDALRARLLSPEVMGQRGTAFLRKLLESETGPAFSRSVAEDRFLELIRGAQLPSPEANARVGGIEVDFLWRELGIGVEVDGFRFHSSRRRFEADRHRDTALASIGVHVIRVTWRQITDEPAILLGRVAMALGRAGARSVAEAL